MHNPISLRIGRGQREGVAVDAIRSPFDGALVGSVWRAGAAEVDDAIAAAVEAAPLVRRMPTHERIAILARAAQLLRERAEELAQRMAREAGKPIRACRAEVERAVVTFSLAAAECTRAGGEVLPADLEPRAEGRMVLTRRVPRGPVAAISPFNFPLNLIAHKVAPAIAVGASVVLKPPPQCPLTGFALAALLEEAGLPAGALNVVHCAPQEAQRLAEDGRIRVLSFTGSDAVGWKLKALAGKKQVLLELGGNAPCIVDETVELERVLEPLLAASFGYAGQVCIKVQRILVHARLFPQFLERFVAGARALPCGDPLDERTVLGPLIEEKHVARVLAWVREAVDAGAKLHCGGERSGNVVTPVVLTGARTPMRVHDEEVFGPVTLIEPFDTFEGALRACNASRFGLQAGVFTRDLSRALQAYRELEFGGVLVNEVPTFRVDNFPYGGTKDSGFGREGVRYAMEEMTEPRVLVLRPD